MLITKTSLLTGIEHTLDIPCTQAQLDIFDNGRGPHIQTVMPNLSADDREFILSGITKEEWNAISFKSNDENDDNDDDDDDFDPLDCIE